MYLELPREPIRRDGIRVARVGRDHATARVWSGHQPGLLHQTRDALGAGRQSRRAQFVVDARGAVGLPAVGERIRTWAINTSSMTARRLFDRRRYAY